MSIVVSVGRRGRVVFCFFLVLALFRVHATDFYVSTQGSDTSPGTSAQPWRTITHAYSLARPGDRILVLPGVYTDYTSGWGIHMGSSGTVSGPITLKSQVKGGAIIDGGNAANRNEGIYLDGSYNIIDGFEIRNNPNGGIAIYGSNNQILNCEIHHNGNPASSSTNGKDGVYSDPSTSGNLYSANSIHDNGRTGSNLDHGLYLCGKNELVMNNLLYGNAASGLQVAGYSTVSNLRVYNNVIALNGTSGIILWQALSGVDIKNNIIYQNGHYGIGSYAAHGSGVVVDHNLAYGNGYGDYNFNGGGSDYTYTQGPAISGSPLLVNVSLAGFDAHLSAGSPAINSGLNLSSVFTTDKDGTARPASGSWDLGAYRFHPNASVVISAPAGNATVSGPAVTVAANVSGLIGTFTVQFSVDGANLGSAVLLPPYQAVWDTTSVSNGVHSLGAAATDLLGNQAIASPVQVTVSNAVPTISPSPLSQTFASTSGTISSPFYATNGALVQPAYTSVTTGGRAAYNFTVPSSGDYLVSALVNAPSTDYNSFFVNIDGEPTDPLMIWDVPVTSGMASRTVSWRGNGTTFTNQFVPKVFNLAAGAHQLIVRGREGNCLLGAITIAPAANLASPWQAQDIGATGLTGLAGVTNGSYLVQGAGTIGGTSDSFRFLYQPMTGDGEIRAQIVAASTAGSQACCGLMLRESLAAGDRCELFGLSPGGSLTGLARTTTSGSALSGLEGSASPPNLWLRIVRTGNIFYAYTSSDGVNWSYVDSGTNAMASNIYAGIAVASGSTTNLASCSLSDVTVIP